MKKPALKSGPPRTPRDSAAWVSLADAAETACANIHTLAALLAACDPLNPQAVMRTKIAAQAGRMIEENAGTLRRCLEDLIAAHREWLTADAGPTATKNP